MEYYWFNGNDKQLNTDFENNIKVAQYKVGKTYKVGENGCPETDFVVYDRILDLLRDTEDDTRLSVYKVMVDNNELARAEQKFTVSKPELNKLKVKTIQIIRDITSVELEPYKFLVEKERELELDLCLKAESSTEHLREVCYSNKFEKIVNTQGNASIVALTGDCSTGLALGIGSIVANTGDGGNSISFGRYTVVVNTGEYSSVSVEDPDSLAVVWGKDSMAKGCVGAYLVLTEWDTEIEGCEYLCGTKMIQVDGKRIKADTYYELKNGEVVEVKEIVE